MDVADLTIEWLQETLGWVLCADDEIKVHPISLSAGAMGGVYRVQAAGQSLVFKCPPTPESPWSTIFTSSGIIDREIEAYRFLSGLGPNAAGLAPACHWSRLTTEGAAALALEDIAQSVGAMARLSAGLSYEETLATLRALARLHAARGTTVGRPEDPPFAWLYSVETKDLITAIAAGLSGLPLLVETRFPRSFPRDRFTRILKADFRQVVEEAHHSSRMLAICHGDCWSGNVLFERSESSAEPAARLIDWQFAMWGNPLSDVALLLLSSLQPAQRRAWTDDLLRAYHATLIDGRRLAYPLDDCRHDLDCAMSFAALVAAATVEAYTFGLTPDDTARVAERMEAAIEDVPWLFRTDGV